LALVVQGHLAPKVLAVLHRYLVLLHLLAAVLVVISQPGVQELLVLLDCLEVLEVVVALLPT
jgi:hypothetical protein